MMRFDQFPSPGKMPNAILIASYIELGVVNVLKQLDGGMA